MAQRRMFSLKVVDTDDFLDMGQGSQLLYFHLAMRADDDGFVNSPKKVMRFAGAKDDDFRVLVAKQFIIPFQSGVIVIKHWKEHNEIRKDRKHDTIYTEEMAQLSEDSNGVYQMSTKCQPNDDILATEVRLGKVRLGQDRVGEVRNTCEPTASPDIPKLIKLFEIVNPSISKLYGNKTQRSACERLLKKWSLEELQSLIENVLPKLNSSQYAKGKSITPLQFEDNLGYIKAFIDTTNNQEAKGIRI